jgi:hypothetical protein
MSVNKYKPHLYVIPEDRRDAQIANGFAQHPRVETHQIQVVPEAGGWSRVLDTFTDEYVPRLQQNAKTHVVMVVDFDGAYADRRADFESKVPEEVRARVFVIGPRDTPEALRKSLARAYEEIGRSLADDCDGGLLRTWGHEQLKHNEPDRCRLLQVVKPFLFS